jgi:hypothetical protein
MDRRKNYFHTLKIAKKDYKLHEQHTQKGAILIINALIVLIHYFCL